MDSMFLYVVRDVVAEQCGPVFEAVNDAVAMRQYRAIVKDCDPAEYQLIRIGRVDRANGQAQLDCAFANVSVVEVGK